MQESFGQKKKKTFMDCISTFRNVLINHANKNLGHYVYGGKNDSNTIDFLTFTYVSGAIM